jgi:hypothetical protein
LLQQNATPPAPDASTEPRHHAKFQRFRLRHVFVTSGTGVASMQHSANAGTVTGETDHRPSKGRTMKLTTLAKRIDRELNKEVTDAQTVKVVEAFWKLDIELDCADWFFDRIALLESCLEAQHGLICDRA